MLLSSHGGRLDVARLPRLDLPHVAQHVVQRGNDRQPCFFSPVDYQRYRHDLREIAMAEDCAIHAYVLMTNHVHLLMTPQKSGSVARVMQALGRRYVRYINDRYHRTGTLWEGRYKACPVDGERYLLRCHRYIDLNPVRAAMVADPADYAWSSFRSSALGHYDPLIRAHPCCRALAATSGERCDAYRALVMEATDDEDIDETTASITSRIASRRSFRSCVASLFLSRHRRSPLVRAENVSAIIVVSRNGQKDERFYGRQNDLVV
jgi:putative transposase